MEISKVLVRLTPGWSSDYRDTRVTIFFDHSGETILQNLTNRHMRPVDIYKSVLPEAIKKINAELTKMDLLPLTDNDKIRWSRKAGCSCPCSPGFLVSRNGESLRGFHAWISIAETSVDLVELSPEESVVTPHEVTVDF